MPTETFTLPQLGWRPFYAQQLTLDDLEAGFAARVAGVHRSGLTACAESGELQLSVPNELRSGATDPAITTGDWVLVEHQTARVLRVFERQSLIARMAAGVEQRPQTIAANVDTLLVVTSCNADFNLSRLERYLAVAFEGRVTPVIVLTKADICADAAEFVQQAQAIAPAVSVLALNATDAATSVDALGPWLGEGQTLALVGSSGVGKSTLANALLGMDAQATAGIREADSKGRHTTTSRQLFRLRGGVWLIDTPGMRELKIGAARAGLSQTFTDLEALASQCRFRDCRHRGDDGCALRAAVSDGRLDPRRLESFMKLSREAERASWTPWQRSEANRRFGQMARAAQKRKREIKGTE